jgi:hypothetical protein
VPLYELKAESIEAVPPYTFEGAGVYERRDLQRLLREHVEVISPDTLIIAEEFGSWDESKRRIDLLGLDRDANLVVIELKRDETGSHMELQAVRYAAMVSTMTFEQAVQTYGRYRSLSAEDAGAALVTFLGWEEPDEEHFGLDVRIVLAAGDFSSELATSVSWLNDRSLDIRCVRMRPYQLDGRILVDVQQVIPPPEAAEVQIKIREKAERIRGARSQYRDFTRYDVDVEGEHYVAQAKRRLIFLVVQRAVAREGASPDEISRLVERNPWAVADGIFDDEDTFTLNIRGQYVAVDRPFDQGRWFTATDELFHSDGKTYAFTKMWSGDDVLKAIENIRERYPNLRISVTPSP